MEEKQAFKKSSNYKIVAKSDQPFPKTSKGGVL